MRLAMLISGGGTTAGAIIRAGKEEKLQGIDPVCVIASQSEIAGIEAVKFAGIPESNVYVISPKNYQTSRDFGEALLQILKETKVDLIGQYGWLCLTPKNVIHEYQDKMINQHPGPLDPGRPDFGGKGMFGRRVHAARLLFVKKVNRDFWSEAAAQRVAIEFDQGAVLKRKQVSILPDDTVETLQKRMLPVEHQVQIETLQDFADGKVKELIREEPLVRPNEIEILGECKKEAVKLYPNG